MDLPREYVIRERHHRVHNPIDETKLATFGAALRLRPGTSILDLCCGSGELLATWSRDYGIVGTGVDISTQFLASARERVAELGVADQVSFVPADASSYVAAEPVHVAACVGATWIGNGVPGTLALLARSLRPGGMLLVGEPFWLKEPPDAATIEASHASSRDDFHDLPALVSLFATEGYDLVEMVLASPDSWDRYHAAQWLSIRTWLDENPDDDLAPAMRAELHAAPLQHLVCREYLGWGVFALIPR